MNPGVSNLWVLGDDGVYLLADQDFRYHHHHRASSTTLSTSSGAMVMAADDSPVLPGDDEDTNDDYFPTLIGATPIDTSLLYLQMSNVIDGIANLNLYNATNYVYAILDTTNLSMPFSDWQVETEVFPSNTNCMPFTVQTQGRTNLFLDAEDWTGVTENGNTTPDWWFWEFYETTDLADSDLDSQGNTLLYDYEHHIDPNVIGFFIVTTNIYVNTGTTTLQLSGISGIPDYEAILINDTNEADAVWEPYSSTNVLVTLDADGNYNIEIGLRGLPANATQTWQSTTITKQTTLPVLTITSPITMAVSQSPLVIQGFAAKALTSLTLDVSNASGVFTGQPCYLTDQIYDTNLLEYTTNDFQSGDIDLAEGTNTITFHAVDWAGNKTNLSLTFNYTASPAFTVTWPQPGTALSGSSFTLQGQSLDPLTKVTASITDSFGNTNTVQGIVENNGTVWAQNMPLHPGTNMVIVTSTNINGSYMTNFTVTETNVGLMINPLGSSQLNKPLVTATGQIGNTNLCVWVNGVQATVHSDGSWSASSVPVSPTGTACLSVQVYIGDPVLVASQNFYQSQPPVIAMSSYSGQHAINEWAGWDVNESINWYYLTGGNCTGPYGFNLTPDEGGIAYADFDGFTTTFYGDPFDSNPIPWEYASISVANDTGSYQGTVQTHVMVESGGQQMAGTTNLYVIFASVNEFSTNETAYLQQFGVYGVPFGFLFDFGGLGDQQYYGDTPLPPESLQINGQTLVNSGISNSASAYYGETPGYSYYTYDQYQNIWGETIVAAPAGKDWDVTPSVIGLTNGCDYTFDLMATNLTLQIVDTNTGANLTDQTTTVIVGQQMNLLCQLSITNLPFTNLVLTNFSWTVPGDAISNYVVVTDTSSAYVATNFPTTNSNVKFYWVDGTSNEVVQVSATVKGVTLTGQATFNVVRPIVAVTAQTSAVELGYNINRLFFGICFGTNDGPPGILFSNTITMPSGNYNYGNTSYTSEWVQVIEPPSLATSTFQVGTNAVVYSQSTTNVVLDTSYSYGFDPGFPYPDTDDSPCIATDQSQEIAASDAQYSKMWLMFQPTNGQWVPLRTVTWNFSGSATNSGSGWFLTSSNWSANPPDADAGATFPIWEGNITNTPAIPNH